MNPFNNKWLALFVVAVVLLVVSEIAGTGGVLSRTAGSAGANGEALPPGVVQVGEGDAVDAGEVPVEDQPQVFIPDSPEVDDSEDEPGEEAEGSEPEEIDPDVLDEPDFEDDGSGDE